MPRVDGVGRKSLGWGRAVRGAKRGQRRRDGVRQSSKHRTEGLEATGWDSRGGGHSLALRMGLVTRASHAGTA